MIIKFNKPTILGFKETLIRPGVNDIPAELVAEMQEDSILAMKFDSGELEIVEIDAPTAKAGKPLSAADRLAAAPEGEAKGLVEKTVDLEILRAWLKKEKRVSLRKLLKAQIAKIKNVEFRDREKGTKYEKEEE